MKTIKSLFLSALFIFPHQSFALSLNEALAAAYNNNPNLQAERENMKATDEYIAQARAGFLPTVQISGKRSNVRSETDDINSTDRMENNGTISVVQPIFNGGKSVAQYKQAKNKIFAERANLLKAEQDTMFNAAQSYMDLLYKQEAAKIYTNNVEVLTKHYEASKERFEVGELTNTDLSLSKAKLSTAISDRINAEGEVAKAKANFKRVIGIEPDGTISFPDIVKDFPDNIQEIVDEALVNNPVMTIAKYNTLAADNQIDIDKAALYPSINAAVSANKATASSNSSKYDGEYIASISLSIPLYQGGAEYSAVRASKIRKSQARYNELDSREQIIEAAIQAKQSYDVATSSIISNKDSVEAAQIAFEGAGQEAEVGTKTIIDVSDREQDLANAKLALIKAKTEQVISMLNIKYVIGKLTAKDLNLTVSLYDTSEHYDKMKYKIIGY